MSDEKNPVLTPLLSEVESTVDSASNSLMSELFSEETLSISMVKIFGLESFLNLATRDCKFNDFMREILNTVLQVVKSEAGSILEVDQSNQSLFFRAVAGQSSDKVVNFTIPSGQGIVGHVVESRLPVKVENIPENSLHLKSIGKAVGFEARNMVALPILVRGRVYGVLELLNRVGELNYSISDMDMLNYLCNMMGKVIEIRLMISWAQKRDQTDRDQEVA